MTDTELSLLFSENLHIIAQIGTGKDSAAMFWRLQPYWDKVTFVWCDQGNPFPEAEAYMMGLAAQVPHFVRIEGQQKQMVERFGHPVDILPLHRTRFGHEAARTTGLMFQSTYDCCFRNLWAPMAVWCKENKVDVVLRGQRKVDKLQAPVAPGQFVDGIYYYFPLENWTDEDVFSFLEQEGRTPPGYAEGHGSSLDCMDCTGWTDHQPNHLRYLDNQHRGSKAAIRVRHVFDTLSGDLVKYIKDMMEL